jgi:arylsulfatase A-like enzyme
MAAAGESNVKEKLLTGFEANGKTYKVHLDGYNQTDLLAGNGPSARKEFFYFTDDGDLAGLRYDKWKMVFLAQQAEGFDVWRLPLVPLRFPFLIDLHADPFERAPEESGNYERWAIDHAYVVVPAQAIVGKFLQSFKEFPPRQKPASFSVDQALKAMQMGND